MAERSRAKSQEQARQPRAGESDRQAASFLRTQSANAGAAGGLLRLQRMAGNQAVQTALLPETSSVSPITDPGGGSPLDRATRRDMEARFGKDFGQVRVHTGPKANEAASALDARAYTSGKNIVFRSGVYQAETPGGKQVLAHELAHVVQQSQAPAGPGVADRLSQANDPAEREASQVGMDVRQGLAVEPVASPGAGIQRDAGWAQRGPDPYQPPAPTLRNYLDRLKVLAAEPGIEKQPQAASRIAGELKGLDMSNEDTFTIIVEQLYQLFPDHIVLDYLVLYASIPVQKGKLSPEGRAMDKTEKLLEVRQPYKTGKYTPGTFFPGMLFNAAGEAIASVPVPPAFKSAAASGGSMVAGVYSGMSESIGPEQLEALVDKLNLAGLLTVAFPPVFLAGAAYGIGEDVVGAVKSVIGLFRGDLGELLYTVLEIAAALMTPEGERVGYEIGKEIGRGFASTLLEMLSQNLVHFTFTLGRLVGPTIVYTVLGMLGFPEFLAAGVAKKVFPILRQFLKNEKRLLRLLDKMEASIKAARLASKKPQGKGLAGGEGIKPPLVEEKVPPATTKPDLSEAVKKSEPLVKTPPVEAAKKVEAIAGQEAQAKLPAGEAVKKVEAPPVKEAPAKTQAAQPVKELPPQAPTPEPIKGAEAAAPEKVTGKGEIGAKGPKTAESPAPVKEQKPKKSPKKKKTQASPPQPVKTLDERIAEAQAKLNESRKKWREYKTEREALEKSKKGGPSKGFWNDQERLWVLKRQKAYPNRQVVEQARMVGIKDPKGNLTKAPAIAKEGRTLDFLEVEGNKVVGGDLKSAEEFKSSIQGGLKKSKSPELEWNPESKIGKQLAKEEQLINKATSEPGSKILIEGVDVRTGKKVSFEVDAKDFESRVFTYEDIYPN